MRNRTSSLAFISMTLLILLGSESLIGAQQSGGVQSLTDGEYVASLPIVNNGRILYHVPFGDTAVSIMLADLQDEAQPSFTEIATAVEVALTGLPDLDENGNVVYVNRVLDQHHIFLYDHAAQTHLQLTSNPDIPASPDIGLATTEVLTGYARVANGHVVFRDVDGNIFLYDSNRRTIQQINQSPDQTANSEFEDVIVQFAADTWKLFEFDGRNIVWLHRELLQEATEAQTTIYLAKPPYDQPIEIANFGAAPGALLGPFLVACGDRVAWQYYPPGPLTVPRLTQATIEYYDGASVRTIRAVGPVLPKTLRIHNGQVAWVERDSEHDRTNLFLFDGGGPVQLASSPDLPANVPIGSRFWTNIDLHGVSNGEVIWLVSCLGNS